jgi:hypothetical protein
MKGSTSRQRRLMLAAHADPCVACGGTIGTLAKGAKETIHALCQARQLGGLPTPCLGHICPVCDGGVGADGQCAGCRGSCIVGREITAPRGTLDKRYDHPDASPRARNALKAHSKPCKACEGTLGTLSDSIYGESIHALCKARLQAGLETPCLGHPCKSCRGEGQAALRACEMCGGRGKVGEAPPPARGAPRPKQPVKRKA